MEEVRIHGRGGDGAVTFAHALAMAAGYGDKYGQSCQGMSALRRGAPVEGYARIDSREIVERGLVSSPDYVVLLTASLARGVDVEAGLKANGRILVNGVDPIPLKHEAVYFDGTSLAIQVTGVPVPNNVMLAAFAAWTELVSLEDILRAAPEIMGHKVPPKTVEKNLEAMRVAYRQMKGRLV